MKTDLNKIKTLAKAFLYVDIAETKVPFIASHPFTNSWYVVIDNSKPFNMVDLHDESNAEQWRKQVSGFIDKCDLMELFFLFNIPYILNFLKFAAKYLSDEDLGRVLGDLWQSIEQISLDDSVTGRQIVSWFRRADKKTLMNDEEREVIAALPDMVTIYRGVTSHNRRKKKAFSWSVDPKIAEWFAGRFSTGTGEVWKRTVPKERILCYFGDREKEVIVNLYGYNDDMIVCPHREDEE